MKRFEMTEEQYESHQRKWGKGERRIILSGQLPANVLDLQEKPNKYGARKVVIDGIVFDSIKEGERYQVLKSLARSGAVSDLQVKVSYDLTVNNVRIGRYTCDFQYTENGETVVEDVKSSATKKARDYGLRKKLMLAIYGITIKET